MQSNERNNDRKGFPSSYKTNLEEKRKTVMGIKGSWKRPRSITREEEELRNDFAYGKISPKVFNEKYAELKRAGLIRRSGQIIQ